MYIGPHHLCANMMGSQGFCQPPMVSSSSILSAWLYTVWSCHASVLYLASSRCSHRCLLSPCWSSWREKTPAETMFPEGYKNPNSASPVLHGDGKSQADCDYEPKPSQTISRKDIINKKGPITLYIGMKLCNLFHVYHNGLGLWAQGQPLFFLLIPSVIWLFWLSKISSSRALTILERS